MENLGNHLHFSYRLRCTQNTPSPTERPLSRTTTSSQQAPPGFARVPRCPSLPMNSSVRLPRSAANPNTRTLQPLPLRFPFLSTLSRPGIFRSFRNASVGSFSRVVSSFFQRTEDRLQENIPRVAFLGICPNQAPQRQQQRAVKSANGQNYARDLITNQLA